jgi:hypothetical protein
MDSSFWTNSNLKHKIRESNRLFYDQYRYCASGELNYAKLLRGFDCETLGHRIKTYRSMTKNEFGYFFYSYGQGRKPIIDQTELCLYNFLDLLESIENDHKIVLGWHDFYFYTNNIDDVNRVLAADGVHAKPVVETVVTHPAKTIVRKRSDYQYRCYLSNSIITQSQYDQLIKFFNNHCESIRLSKTFREWLDKDYKYCRDYFFFDYNDSGLSLLLEMIIPGLIKETVKIITQD